MRVDSENNMVIYVNEMDRKYKPGRLNDQITRFYHFPPRPHFVIWFDFFFGGCCCFFNSFFFLFHFHFSKFEYSCSPDRSICNGILGNIPNTDLFQMNHNNINMNGPIPSDDYLEHDDGAHFFGNKCMPMKTLDNTDYMIVSSEEIIDILDLTNDEVEQILDDNMISTQDFDTLNSPRLSQSTSLTQPFNRVPRINLATNLKKVASPTLMVEYEGKTIDMRSLETPTINLDTGNSSTEHDVDSIESAKLITDQVSVVKKKSGRTKGARQISKCFLFVCLELFSLSFSLSLVPFRSNKLTFAFEKCEHATFFHQIYHIYKIVSFIGIYRIPPHVFNVLTYIFCLRGVLCCWYFHCRWHHESK